MIDIDEAIKIYRCCVETLKEYKLLGVEHHREYEEITAYMEHLKKRFLGIENK